MNKSSIQSEKISLMVELSDKIVHGKNSSTIEECAAFIWDWTIVQHIVGAYEGSLDSALELHEKLVPGYFVEIRHWNARTGTIAEVGAGFKALSKAKPSRAWLIAILRAEIDKEKVLDSI